MPSLMCRELKTRRRRMAVLTCLGILLAAQLGCSSEDAGNDKVASPDSDAASQSVSPMAPTEPSESESQASSAEAESGPGDPALGAVFKTADITVTHPDGYELNLDVVVHEPQTVSITDAPEECSEFGSFTGGEELLRLVPVETTATDTSGGDFAWPDTDPVEWTLFSDDWKACKLGGDDSSVDISLGASNVHYFAVIAESTPKEPEGDFAGVDPIGLRIASVTVGGEPVITGCPDNPQAPADPCVIGPEIS